MKKSQIGYFIIASAIVWAFVMIACASVLSGTIYKQEIMNFLIAGASFHLLFIWAPLGKQFAKKRDDSEGK